MIAYGDLINCRVLSQSRIISSKRDGEREREMDRERERERERPRDKAGQELKMHKKKSNKAYSTF